MAADREHELKKKLQSFLSEMLKVGTVKGFRYFAMYMRSREEMVVSVLNEPQVLHNDFGSETSSPTRSVFDYSVSPSESFTSNNLPYDRRSLMLSAKSQQSWSHHRDQEAGLQPASPCDREMANSDESSTIFLVAGYTRYLCPYVWVRTNHQRLVKLTESCNMEKDQPLKLRTTKFWTSADVQPWDVLLELVRLCTYPVPRNPFEVDFDYFEQLPLQERVLATGAMVNLLQKIICHKKEDKPYLAHVSDDLHKMAVLHFKDVQSLTQQGMQILQDQRQRTTPNQTDKNSSQFSQRWLSHTQPSYL